MVFANTRTSMALSSTTKYSVVEGGLEGLACRGGTKNLSWCHGLASQVHLHCRVRLHPRSFFRNEESTSGDHGACTAFPREEGKRGLGDPDRQRLSRRLSSNAMDGN